MSNQCRIRIPLRDTSPGTITLRVDEEPTPGYDVIVVEPAGSGVRVQQAFTKITDAVDAVKGEARDHPGFSVWLDAPESKAFMADLIELPTVSPVSGG